MSTITTICHVIRQGKIGGGESHVLSLVSRLDPNKFRSVVISLTDGPMVDRLKEMGVAHHVLHTTVPFNPLISNQLSDILETEDVDIVHAHGTRAASNCYRSARNLDIPLVYTIHGWSFHDDQNSLTYTSRKLSEKYLTARANLNICVSHANEQLGKELFGLESSTVIHNGVDFDRFNPEVNRRKEIRAELGIPDDAFCFAYIVRMTRQKDPLNFILGASIAAARNPKLHFLVVGDGELLEEAKTLARAQGQFKQFTFTGFRTDVPALLSACEGYTLPSLWEGLPIGIIEAMAMRKIIVASDIEANAELIVPEVHGKLVPTKTPKKLASALLECSLNVEISEAMAQQAFEKAQQWFDLTKMTHRIEGKYHEVLSAQSTFGSSYPMPNEPRQTSVE